MSPELTEMTEELRDSLAESNDLRAQRDLPDGLHQDLPESVYHARILGIASKSGLDEFRRSPAHYRAWIEGARERSTKALSFGRALHCAVLEPERFMREYVVAPDFGDCRKRENKLARDAWTKDHRDCVVIRNAEGVAQLGMIRSMVRHPLVASLFDGGTAEVSARWTDATTGVKCKCRVDHYRPDLATAIDVKSAEDARREAFQRSVWNYGYHRQDAFYSEGLRTLGAPVANFLFVVVEKSPPHAIAIYQLDEEARRRGLEENEDLLKSMARCIARDDWPAYPETLQTLELPRWAQ